MDKHNTNPLIDTAIAIATEGYPVFPTINKRPCWSNKELELATGQGGYKIATLDEAEIQRLFSHANAVEIAVPMGQASGLICIDVDTDKDESLNIWIKQQTWLKGTRTHRTRSGGYHFFFRYNKHRHNKLPQQLRPNVDIKGNGGFVCWVGTPGYKLIDKSPPATLPADALNKFTALAGKRSEVWYNNATDAELIADIKSAMSLYPALLSLSWRYMHFRRMNDGRSYSPDIVKASLKRLMHESVAADPHSNRHNDWLDRIKRIDSMVDSAATKQAETDVDNKTSALLSKLRVSDSPINIIRQGLPSPEHEPSCEDDSDIANVSDSALRAVNPYILSKKLIPPIDWIIPNVLPAYSIVSLAGASNVGKTRWLALLASCCIMGDSRAMGLPRMTAPVSVLWIANEERTDDIERRIKAVCRHYEWVHDTANHIYILGKDTSRLQLIRQVNGSAQRIAGNIKFLTDAIIKRNVRVLLFDPYVSLASGIAENSADDTDMINEAFLDIIAATGVSILHAHHAPKDNNKEADWYAGSSSAWRGSSVIYSSLDCGFTLAPVIVKGAKKQNKKRRFETAVNYVVLESAKIREGERILPVYYELTGQSMATGEGHDIAICKLSTREEAEDAINKDAKNHIALRVLANALINTLGSGQHTNFNDIHRSMRHYDFWVSHAAHAFPSSAKKKLLSIMGNSLINGERGSVQYIQRSHPQGDCLQITIKK